ncbi:MAG: hypothetical protein A3D74_02920 [Candidatus Levybacteria bacterium RIFCSPHIGHO2_02_FULL_37_13]|nr:MAG: hypothetical protein A3D74_02920 [Candidatus Levybacteria bacterium RIFCSPHIGHO2_02_FULL_37_13]OGH29350.1 MAG: hypothetical protein A3E40_00840 [Candidatus Levybacteria bacterium RIFCSPHIGHO2_12_FULL_37_9]OGH40142.1 MAG: hypothetical protein A3B41_04800 [Candidatus Levybacteria bacterium RIFCSPLOWO2_01_FULL_37_26]
MTATGHAVLGTIIAAKIGNPILAIPLAVASHIAADIFPHWDTATNRDKKGKKRVIIESFFDLIFGLLLSYTIIFLLFPQTNFLYVLFLILAAQSLDWLMIPYYFFNINFPLFKWAYKFQKSFNHDLDKPWGIINQVAVLVLIVILAKIF